MKKSLVRYFKVLKTLRCVIKNRGHWAVFSAQGLGKIHQMNKTKEEVSLKRRETSRWEAFALKDAQQAKTLDSTEDHN